jgi:pimeloyl-ACP methyl ester carboxylesterase
MQTKLQTGVWLVVQILCMAVVSCSAAAVAKQGGFTSQLSPTVGAFISDGSGELRWDSRFKEVAIPSSVDATEQRAYSFLPTASAPSPLLVSLHSWSADYRQVDPFANLAAEEGWHYIHPDFRGPNSSPQSCMSPAALADIDDAIEYVIETGNVDKDRIYVVGGSGGGHASCAIALKSRHQLRSVYAWVPITDIAAWYHQSIDRNAKYAKDIEAIIGSSEDENFYERARQRSPISMELPLKANRIHLFAGVRDGYEGSVPISHSLLFFNRLCSDTGEFKSVVPSEVITALLSRDIRGAVGELGGRRVVYFRSASFGTITIFDGAHETLHEACFRLLIEDAAGRDYSIEPTAKNGSTIPLNRGPNRVGR